MGARHRLLSAGIALALVLSGTAGTATGAETDAQTVTVDASSPGRAFDGVGALSAGASSRLLADYPPAERDRILDVLFRPGYGAQLQVLPVELRGATNSTAGSEPSHRRSCGDLDCGRGYECWLMKETKRRNPEITLTGLQWGAPGWLRGGFWSDDNIAILLD